jgi:hypothetical protein
MFTALFSFSLFVALIQSVLAQSNFTINTPTFVQCQPTLITWIGSGYPPYDLLVVSAQDVCGVALEDLGNQTSTVVTWTVNLAAGTQVLVVVEDEDADEAWSGVITVGDSNDTSCLTSTSPSGTATSSSPSSSALAPVGNAGSGLAPVSGALSTRPLSAVTLLGSLVLAVVAFTL